MKEIDNENRTRRHIHIDNSLYKEVAKEAVDLEVDYGTIVDIALKLYFDAKEETK